MSSVAADRAHAIEPQRRILSNASTHGLVDEHLVAGDGRIDPMLQHPLREDDRVAIGGGCLR